MEGLLHIQFNYYNHLIRLSDKMKCNTLTLEQMIAYRNDYVDVCIQWLHVNELIANEIHMIQNRANAQIHRLQS